MIYGAGELILCFNTEDYGLIHLPPCAAEFAMSINLSPEEVRYLNSEGLIQTREAGPKVEEYRFLFRIKDIDFSHMMAAYGELAIFTEGLSTNSFIQIDPLTSIYYTNTLIADVEQTWAYNVTDRSIMIKTNEMPDEAGKYFVDVDNDRIEFHPDDVGKSFDIAIGNPSDTFGAIGNQSVFEKIDDVSFQGKFFATTQDQPYTIVANKLDKVSLPTYDHVSSTLSIEYVAVLGETNDRKPVRIYNDGVSGFNISDEQLEVLFLFAEFPTSFDEGASSVLNLSGVAQFVTNPDNLLIENVAFTSVFDFAVPGTETINFSTNAQGAFAISYVVDSGLTYPDNGFLTVTLDETGQIQFQQAVDVIEPILPPFNGLVSGGELEQQSITIEGDGQAGETVTINTTGLGGFLDGTVLEVRLNNTWSYSDFLPPSVLGGTMYTVTLTHSRVGDTPIVINKEVENRTFSPVVNHTGKFRTNAIVNLVNSQTVRPNQDIDIQIESPDLVFVSDTFTSTDVGSFSYQYTIPPTEQDKQLTYTFTEVSTATVVVDSTSTIAPEFNFTPLFSLDPGQGNVIAGEPGATITGTMNGSEEWLFQIRLIGGDGLLAGNANVTGLGNSTAKAWQLSPNIGFFTGPATPYIELTEDIHNTVTITPISPTDVVILEGFEAEIDNTGLIIPDINLNISGQAPRSANVTVNVFSTNYNTTADSLDGSWAVVIPISAIQPVGMYTATVSTAGRTNIDLDFDIVSPSLTLNACPSGLYFSNDGNMFVFSGEILPGKDVTLTFTGIDGRAPQVVTGDQDGTWSYALAVAWLPSGSWDVTITSPSETTIVCTGMTHEARLTTIPSSLNFLQGDTGNSLLVRGPDNDVVDYVVEGALADTGTLLLNALGFATLNLADLPLLTPSPATDNINLTTQGTGQNEITSYDVNTRVPITISVSNPSAIAEGGDPILWTNSTFLVVGDTPTNGVYSLTAIGSATDFSLLTALADGYTANLETAADAGTVELTVSTVFQPQETEAFIVSPITSFEIPPSLIINNMYDLVIFGEDGTLAEITVTSSLDGIVLQETGTIGETTTGEFRVNFDTTGLNDPATLFFNLSTEYFTFPIQDRVLNGINSGLPSTLVTQVSSQGGILGNPNYEITDILLELDNQPINEAGFPSDLVSQFEMTWTAPVSTEVFQEYLIESYENAITHWSTFSVQTTESIILTDIDFGYRVTAIHSGNIYGQPQYLAPSANTAFAKTVVSTQISSDGVNTSDVTAVVPGVFYIGFLTASEESALTSQVSSDGINTSNITPTSPSPFFTFTTIFQEESSLSSNVSSDGINTSDLTPSVPSPFFTV